MGCSCTGLTGLPVGDFSGDFVANVVYGQLLEICTVGRNTGKDKGCLAEDYSHEKLVMQQTDCRVEAQLLYQNVRGTDFHQGFDLQASVGQLISINRWPSSLCVCLERKPHRDLSYRGGWCARLAYR